MSERSSASTPPRLRLLHLAGIVAGLGLFALAIQRAGAGATADAIRSVGLGFFAIVALGGLRLAARAAAWTRAVDPADGRLPLGAACAAVIAGESLGNITPLGLLLSEPAKVAYLRDRLPVMTTLPALAVETLLYSVSVVVMIAVGTTALLASYALPDALRLAGEWTLVAAAGGLVCAFVLFRMKVRLVSGVMTWIAARGLRWTRHESHVEQVRSLEDRIYGFAARRRGGLAALLACEAAFHALGVAEVYITLALMSGAPPTLLSAFVLEAVNRLITVVFKFVPLRLGVDEAGSGLLARALDMTSAAGVALAIVRKARVLVWTFVGLALLARRGLPVRLTPPDVAHADSK